MKEPPIDIANEEAGADALAEWKNTQRLMKSLIRKIDFKLEKRFMGISIWMNYDDAIELKKILNEIIT